MSIVADIVLVVVILFFVILFAKTGMAKILKKVGKTIISTLCSLVIGPWATTKVVGILRAPITEGTYKSFDKILQNSSTGYNLKEFFGKIPEAASEFLGHMGVNVSQLQASYGMHENASQEIIREMSTIIAEPCFSAIGFIIGHAIAFLVPLIVMWWIARMVETRQHPFFRGCDHVVGFINGCVVGYLAALGLAVLFYTFFQTVVAFQPESTIMEIYNNSYVFKFMREFDALGTINKVSLYLTSLKQ